MFFYQMIGILTFIFILIISGLVTKVATIALIHTGLSRNIAKFQASSAFTGVGYPGKESEIIINHPVRRKIIFVLMLLGKAGLVTIITTFLVTFIQHNQDDFLKLWQKIAILVSSSVLLWGLFASTYFDIWFSKIINKLLKKFTPLHIRDYAAILHLSGEYEIAELMVDTQSWLAGKTLAETGLRHEGISIMGITRKDGTFLGAPNGAAKIMIGDSLLMYGRSEYIEELDRRKKGVTGKLAHEISVEENIKQQEKQLQRDPVAKREQHSYSKTQK